MTSLNNAERSGKGLPQISVNQRRLTALVKQAQQGSSAAFAQLYEIYFDRAYYTAYKVLHDAGAVEEVVQEAFLRVLTKIDTLQEPEKFNSWFFSVIYYQAMHYMRDNRAAYQMESLDAIGDFDARAPEVIDAEFLPAEALTIKEDRALLLRLIDELSVTQRVALILYYYDELSITQIAEVLGVSSPAVSKRLYDARNTLKTSFIRESQSAGAPIATNQAHPVLQQLMQEEAPTEEYAEARQRTTAWIAGCLPAILATQASKSSIVPSGLKGLLGGAQTQSAHVAVAPHILPIVAKVACGIAASALLTGGVWYGVRQVAAHAAPSTPPAKAAVQTVGSGASASVTTTPTTAAKQKSTSDTASGTAALTAPASASDPTPRPVITTMQTTITYPVGTILTAERILHDSGAGACDAQGTAIAVTLHGLEIVNSNREGSYQVYLHATDNISLGAKTKVLTIVLR